ncbi:hypothetical protein jhhlp_007819 [Lomentospora prolificans]|uniref:AA1-like domain-containing protein n=1 Tax=Lomentospora prolificans TaxID=41688 RepID=A0A2N3N0N2_9PEZI|nr:hypothetical protein jhhlp_007819 [Lomentospora prolificans]
MKAILTSILLLTPALALPAPQEATPSTTRPAAIPEPSTEPTCSQRSMNFQSWDLADFVYEPLAPTAEDPSVSRTTVSFTILNSVIQHQTVCSARSATKFNGTVVFDCEEVTGDDPNTFEGGMATFGFDATSGNVTLTQRWICHDDPVWPTYFTAVGSGVADLSCAGEGVTAENDASEEDDCAGSTVRVNVTEISAIA